MSASFSSFSGNVCDATFEVVCSCPCFPLSWAHHRSTSEEPHGNQTASNVNSRADGELPFRHFAAAESRGLPTTFEVAASRAASQRRLLLWGLCSLGMRRPISELRTQRGIVGGPRFRFAVPRLSLVSPHRMLWVKADAGSGTVRESVFPVALRLCVSDSELGLASCAEMHHGQHSFRSAQQLNCPHRRRRRHPCLPFPGPQARNSASSLGRLPLCVEGYFARYNEWRFYPSSRGLKVDCLHSLHHFLPQMRTLVNAASSAQAHRNFIPNLGRHSKSCRKMPTFISHAAASRS